MPEPSVRETIAQELENLLSQTKLTPEQRKSIKSDLVDTINAKVDVPYIGEKIEAAVISLLLGIFEGVILRVAKDQAAVLIDKIRG